MAGLETSNDQRGGSVSYFTRFCPLLIYACRLSGMPDQQAYDQAMAVAQLVLGHLHPAYLASLTIPPADLYKHIPTPPSFTAGITTPLPPSLTGEGRALDIETLMMRGVQALEALDVMLDGTDWALGAL